MKKMLLVDGNSMLFRAFYATIYTRAMSTSQGIPTNAVFAFANMLNKALEIIQPDAVLVAFDSAKKNFRHELYSDYKGGRKQTPEELIVQFSIVREYLDAMNICRYEQPGIEADDIIGSLVKQYPDWDINVLSSDHDLLQVIDKTTSVWLMKKGISEIEEMTGGAGSNLGTGGMATKIKAAKIACEKGVDMVIANGNDPDILYDIIDGKDIGTRFLGKR